MSDGYFDAAVASTYDKDHGVTDAAVLAASVDRLAEITAGGTALEFAIGTGRIALPLAKRGVDVAGIELSQAMVDVMRARPGGAALPVTIGDMTAAQHGASHALVYLVFNTINNLTTQAAQVACFQNAARHLRPGGRFLIEVQVPPVQHLPLGTTHRSFAFSDDHWGIDTFDLATQSFTSHHIWIGEGTVRRLSIPMRSVWPAELDLMAQLAGLALEARSADWTGAPFTAESPAHISIWRKVQTKGLT